MRLFQRPLPGSLRLRFLLAITVWVVLGISAIWLSATSIFRTHVEHSYHEELEVHVRELGGLTRVNNDGKLELVRPLSDPRYIEPLSGFYWQITADGREPLRSASMTRGTLDEQIAHSPQILHKLENGPTGPAITYGFTRKGPKGEDIHFVIATDQSELNRLLDSFTRDLTLWLVMLGLLLLATGLAIISFGLHPLDRLAQATARLRRGEAQELEGNYPAEIAPLAENLNAYIKQNSEMIARARVQAGNLAHSLRTPLAVITDEAERMASRKGCAESARTLLDQGRAMEQQIEYQLARARSSAGQPAVGQVTRIPDVALPIINAMQRLHPDKQFHCEAAGCGMRTIPVDTVDFAELLSILLDNAGKWARQSVGLAFSCDGHGTLTAIITDDGAGMSADELASAFELGVRHDPAKPGSGLGLAIARDIAHDLKLELTLRNETDGFSATLVYRPARSDS
ncbi:MAG: HAMP domain-containing histidine kinase [Sphingomonadaceae bacterium]|nr:HAMP domain-containing histidine kinase [Sphingomonadaceae bacterium]